MSGKSFCVMEIDGTRLVAVAGVLAGGRVEARQWLSVARPDDVALDDPAAVGAWVRAAFEKERFSRGRVIMAVSRGDVVLKRFGVPAGELQNEAELGNLVRLQMARQLTMGVEGTAIDYAADPSPMGKEGGGKDAASDSALTMVTAGAMPADRVTWCRAVASAAGLKLESIGLRCSGASELLAEMSQRRSGTLLGVGMGFGSSEFVIVSDGRMVFARAADAVRPGAGESVEAFADKIAVEAKRTWTSHRSAMGGEGIEAVLVLGEGQLARIVAERCGAALEAGHDTVGVPRGVSLPSGMPDHEASAAMPLLGLVLLRTNNRPTLDFLNPRKAPDVSARRRQRVLAAVLGVIVVGGGGWQWSRMELDRLSGRVTQATAALEETRGRYASFLTQHARLKHMEAYRAAKIDWLGHLDRVHASLPSPADAQLEDLSGTMRATIAYTPGKGEGSSSAYPRGQWSTPARVTFVISGRANRREVSNELRERLIADGVYEVGNRGPDVADRFSLDLQSTLASPEDLPAKPAADGNAKAAGGAR